MKVFYLGCRYELSYEGDHASSATAAHATHKSHGVEKGIAVHDKAHAHESHTVNGERTQGKFADVPNAEKHSGHGGGQNQNGEVYERFRFAKCKIPMPLTMMRAKGVPLPASYVEVRYLTLVNVLEFAEFLYASILTLRV